MKKAFLTRINSFVLTVICTTAIIMSVSIAKDGMYLLGVPATRNVTQVEVACPALMDEVKVITDADEASVLWRGNAHALKNEGMFVRCAQAIFFFGEIVEA